MALARFMRDPLGDPFEELSRLGTEFSRLFDSVYGRDNAGLFDRHYSPAIDVFEASDRFIVTVEIPGVEKKDLSLSISGNVLTIKGEKRKKDDKKSFRHETWSGQFQRTISLPETSDSDKVDADLRDGELRITVRKKAFAQPKQIEVAVK